MGPLKKRNELTAKWLDLDLYLVELVMMVCLRNEV